MDEKPVFAFGVAFFFFLCTRITLFRRHYALFMYCLQDPQLLYSEKILKMGPTTLFTHLKIILLQYFQFSVFSFRNLEDDAPLPIKTLSHNFLLRYPMFSTVMILKDLLVPTKQILSG